MNGMSYNKLVEKLLEFRSLSAEQSHSSERCAESAADTQQPINEDMTDRKASGVAEDATVGEGATSEEGQSDEIAAAGSVGGVLPNHSTSENCAVPPSGSREQSTSGDVCGGRRTDGAVIGVEQEKSEVPPPVVESASSAVSVKEMLQYLERRYGL